MLHFRVICNIIGRNKPKPLIYQRFSMLQLCVVCNIIIYIPSQCTGLLENSLNFCRNLESTGMESGFWFGGRQGGLERLSGEMVVYWWDDRTCVYLVVFDYSSYCYDYYFYHLLDHG